MFLTILLLPFLGGAVTGLLGRKIGVKGSHFLASGFIIIATLLAINYF